MEEFGVKINHDAKLKELLRNLTSVESNICSDASKQFIKILKSESGSGFLNSYVQSSSKLVEISQAWEFWKTKPGFLHILNLISGILKHRDGKRNDDADKGVVNTYLVLDRFARMLIEDKIGDLYKELNSKEVKRQKAVLLLLTSIVLRNSHLAWEVGKIFDFKLPIFAKLAEIKLRGSKVAEGIKRKHSTRKSFVGFAMAFLEVGHPRLLRGILQQKEMYSRVLRGLGSDDEETVVYVLTILRDKVLVPESLVPAGLRSVLFGSATLEQLINISGRNDSGDAAEIAHNVLVLVCTNPENGLMPDLERNPSPLRGNPKRLMDLMKKLRATEVEYHLELLLSIVKGSPLFGSGYLDEFPYNLEDPSSINWWPAVSVAANVVSSVGDGLTVDFVGYQEPPPFESPYVQKIIKCIIPRPFTRLIINKGLLHSDPLVKHGTLRLVLEALNLLHSVLNLVDSSTNLDKPMVQKWASFKTDIVNQVRLLFPDPQVLLSLLNPINSQFNILKHSMKRKSVNEVMCTKRLKRSTRNEDIDIVVGGFDSFPEVDLSGSDGKVSNSGDDEPSKGRDGIVQQIGRLWRLHESILMDADLNDGDTYFYSKLLDTLKIYHCTMPNTMQGSFDFFKFLPRNPLSLPSLLQKSLLQLLNEHVHQFSKDMSPVKTHPQMFRHLHSFMILFFYSPSGEVKELAYVLAKAAILSTGAFENNSWEISAWFLFIPGYCSYHIYDDHVDVEIFQKLSAVIISFLCDAVSTIGNNLYKYMGFLRHYISDAEGCKDLCNKVSPFIICILEKCVRLLTSDSGSFTLPQKSLISLYACNTIKYLLDTGVNSGALSFLIDRVFSEKFEAFRSEVGALGLFEFPCELKPLKTLLCLSRNILHQQCYTSYSNVEKAIPSDNSFINTLTDIKKILAYDSDSRVVGVAVGFSFALVCTSHSELLQNFPLTLSISAYLHKIPFSVLASVLFLESHYLKDILKLWPEMVSTGVDTVIHGKEKEMMIKVDLDSMETASMAFALYLKQIPFCVLFSAIVQSSCMSLFGLSALQKFLLAKLTTMRPDDLISSFCNILFWINHARSTYRGGFLDELELLPDICFKLAEHTLRHLFIQNPSIITPDHIGCYPSLHYASEVSEVIFNHPVVTELLSGDLSGDVELPGSIFEENLEVLLEMADRGIHQLDRQILNFLTISSEILFSVCDSHKSEQDTNASQRISEAFRVLMNKQFLMFKNEFDRCIQSSNFNPLVSRFYALHTFLSFISPFELLELVNWLFSKVDFHDANFPHSKQIALCVGLHLACCAFDFLAGSKWQKPYLKSEVYFVSGATDKNHLNISLFEEIFVQVFEIARLFNIYVADICLLKAVKVVKSQKIIQNPCISSVMDLSQIMASTPVDIISHCLRSINRIKAEILFLVAELNPIHLSVFGQIFSEAIRELLLPTENFMQKKFTTPFSDKELVMLLPTVFLYLSAVISKFGGQPCQACQRISLLYQHTLMDGFSDWPKFVSDRMFEMELHENKPSSIEELSSIFSDSLLGKAVLVVKDHPTLGGDLTSLEWRLSIFDSVCTYSKGVCNLFDHEIDEAGLLSLKKPFDFVNRVVAKINFCRMLLVTGHNKLQSEVDGEEEKQIPLKVVSAVKNSITLFLQMLINSWTLIVKNFRKNMDNSENIYGENILLFSFLEGFVMSNILDLVANWQDYLIKMSHLPYVEELVKSFFIFRFQDYTTQKMLQTLLTSLSEGNFACASLIQLLLAHSQFTELISLPCKSLVSAQLGMVFTPTQSILKLSTVPRPNLVTLDCLNDAPTFHQHINRLELVKIIKILFHISIKQRGVNSGEATGVQSRELIYLLLSAYGATCAEVDLEIYDLILEIESNDKSSTGTIAQVDYLWGIASLKARKDGEKEIHLDDQKNMDVVEERRKICFRENLPIDPKICVQTVLYFPYNRSVIGGNEHKFNSEEDHSTTADKMQIYDPVFILRFSNHCLSMNFMEPSEFASLGLLAITFVSISSLDDDMRKLGYEVLAKLKSALEKRHRKKDVSRIRLLLSYLQNGIEEPWQRIPSVVAVFMAEASLVLLDPSHDNYSTICKYLMNAPTLNAMIIPLFQKFFWSSSVTFRAEKLWILRLIYAGLNVEDDSHAYIRNSIFENILSFYSSPLSDQDSRDLIVQIVKKAVKLHKLAWVLVERFGLILWLSSIISALCCYECGDRKKITLTHLPIVLEVVDLVTLSRNIVEWLQKHALEQLSELSYHLFKLLVGGSDLIIEQSSMCNSILKTLTLVLKISQKRKIYQAHFTLTENGLFQLCEVCFRARSNSCKVLVLEAVLMSIPVNILQMDSEKLPKFLGWLIRTATQLNSTKNLKHEDFDYHLISVSKKNQDEDSLMSTLLRWLTASVILGKISCKVSKRNSTSLLERSGLQNLQSLLDFDGMGFEESADYRREDILAGAIFYLLQLLGFSHSFLPSAVSALSLLLLSRFSESEFLVSREISLQSLCSKIRCPVEADPSWRWSFYQPWRDLSIELSAMEKLEEIHACEKLLIIFSDILRKKLLSSSPRQYSMFNNLDKFDVYDWEMSRFQSK